jgi:hypothetical protein
MDLEPTKNGDIEETIRFGAGKAVICVIKVRGSPGFFFYLKEGKDEGFLDG